jgi:hypothetical protein
MAEDTENMWEIPEDEPLAAPSSILRKQAEKLSSVTNDLLVGSVVSEVSANEIVHVLRITVPSLENYYTDIVTCKHGTMIYPAQIGAPEEFGIWGSNPRELTTPEQLEESLRKTLKSERVKKVIQSLIAQASDAATAGVGKSSQIALF